MLLLLLGTILFYYFYPAQATIQLFEHFIPFYKFIDYLQVLSGKTQIPDNILNISKLPKLPDLPDLPVSYTLLPESVTIIIIVVTVILIITQLVVYMYPNLYNFNIFKILTLSFFADETLKNDTLRLSQQTFSRSLEDIKSRVALERRVQSDRMSSIRASCSELQRRFSNTVVEPADQPPKIVFNKETVDYIKSAVISTQRLNLRMLKYQDLYQMILQREAIFQASLNNLLLKLTLKSVVDEA